MSINEAIALLAGDAAENISNFDFDIRWSEQEAIDYFTKLKEAVKVANKYLGNH